MNSISKERRDDIRLWVSGYNVPAASEHEILALLDLADERDRYRALLKETVDRVNDRLDAEENIGGAGERFEAWIERIDAALEGKTND